MSASPLGEITAIEVTAMGQGPAPEGCAAFTLTSRQARVFFRRAVVITPRQQHDLFLLGPCAVRGTLKTPFGHWDWEIRNAGTARVIASDGEVVLLADPRQRSTLDAD